MTSVLGVPDEFQSRDNDTYTIVADQSGLWMDSLGRPCHLLSIDQVGETRWIVSPDTDKAGDHEAVAHFDLTPWWQGGEMNRRDSEGDRRKRDRRVKNRRQP